MVKYKVLAEKLSADGVTLERIGEELNYRENASDGCRWDDDLHEYTTGELEQIEAYMTKKKAECVSMVHEAKSIGNK